jgi:hypothetical protein
MRRQPQLQEHDLAENQPPGGSPMPEAVSRNAVAMADLVLGRSRGGVSWEGTGDAHHLDNGDLSTT